MKNFSQSIYPELCELGAQRHLQGTLDEDSFAVGGMELACPQGIAYDAMLTNTGEAILLQGTARVHAQTACARCLEPATCDIEGDIEGYYLLEAQDEVEGYAEDEFEMISADGTFDISDAILGALTEATPYVILCKDDCKGLCAQCGSNLNEGSCDCGEAIDPMNPFAALADYKFD